jgi:hypothetical protein
MFLLVHTLIAGIFDIVENVVAGVVVDTVENIFPCVIDTGDQPSL